MTTSGVEPVTPRSAASCPLSRISPGLKKRQSIVSLVRQRLKEENYINKNGGSPVLGSSTFDTNSRRKGWMRIFESFVSWTYFARPIAPKASVSFGMYVYKRSRARARAQVSLVLS